MIKKIAVDRDTAIIAQRRDEAAAALPVEEPAEPAEPMGFDAE